MKALDIGLKSNNQNRHDRALNARLADLLDLSLAVKQAHWNSRARASSRVDELLDGGARPARYQLRHGGRAHRPT